MLLVERPLSHASISLAAMTSVACGSAWFRGFQGPEVAGARIEDTIVTVLVFGLAQLVVAYIIGARIRRLDVAGVRPGLEQGLGVGLPCACATVGQALLGGPTPLANVLVLATFAVLSATLMGAIIGGLARSPMRRLAPVRRSLSVGSWTGRL